MKREQAKTVQVTEAIIPIEGMRVGRIVHIDEGGLPWVDFAGNVLGPVIARTTSLAKAELLRLGDPAGREILLSFENNDPQYPIIVDTMYSLLNEIAEHSTTVIDADEQREVLVDGKRIVLEAENEIVLKCGKASITLTSAGKVLIKGEYVLSHSSGNNRIRGGSVSIN
jgi:hypothetical protein